MIKKRIVGIVLVSVYSLTAMELSEKEEAKKDTFIFKINNVATMVQSKDDLEGYREHISEDDIAAFNDNKVDLILLKASDDQRSVMIFAKKMQEYKDKLFMYDIKGDIFGEPEDFRKIVNHYYGTIKTVYTYGEVGQDSWKAIEDTEQPFMIEKELLMRRPGIEWGPSQRTHYTFYRLDYEQ
jgi:hypothetical protein